MSSSQQSTDPQQEVTAIVKAAGSSFYWGMRILRKDRRDAVFAIYAYCRVLDDIADEEGSDAEKTLALNAWRDEVARLYEGRPQTVIGKALLPHLQTYKLPRAEFDAIIDGMVMDLGLGLVAPTWEELHSYCRRVAGAVGRLSVRAFGATEPEADELALVLGEALQFTNILRDLDEDTARGRLYLPQELLQEAGLEGSDPSTLLADPRSAAVLEAFAAVTAERFEQAQALIQACDSGPMRPARMMMACYHSLLRRMQAAGWAPPRPRVRQSRLAKLCLMARHALFA